MSYEQITCESREDILLITLNRPDKLNAYTSQMRLELEDAIERANQDREIGAIVVTGAGRGFCAGADIKQSFQKRLNEAEGDGEAAKEARRPGDWVELCRRSKPLVAAVNGVAVGVGLTLILPFDIIVASEAARFGMFFVRMGVVPELGSSHFAIQRLGFAKASEMCLTGRLYEASEVADTGLVNCVVAPDDLLPQALALAREIAANPASSLRLIKELLSVNGSCEDLTAVQAREVAALEKAYASAEHKEAVSAFLEKRKPDFKRAAGPVEVSRS